MAKGQPRFKPASSFSSAKRPSAKRATKSAGKAGKKGNAWAAYVGGGSSGGHKYGPIPD
jgi:hypothetical protein